MAEQELQTHADVEPINTSGVTLSQLAARPESALVHALIELLDPERPGRGPLGGGFDNKLIGY
ncbi:hypothetical protein GCM10010191_00350 [Actinomadura vinacea]|uniref:FXSXX-COOH protein n=1 Tax=Actinomadura vinacea TaxID=115336 RepID=A0ABN3I8I3_9ACTN